MTVDEKIWRSLGDLNCPCFRIGFKYLSEAIMICYLDENAIYNLKVNVYTKIAEKFGAHPKTVESNIRSVISRCKEKELEVMSGKKLDGKPTPKTVISIVVSHLNTCED